MNKISFKAFYFILFYFISNHCFGNSFIVNDSLKIDTIITDINFHIGKPLLIKILREIENSDYRQFGNDSKISNIIISWNKFMETNIFDNAKVVVGTFYENTKTDTKLEFFETNYIGIFELFFENHNTANKVYNFFDKVKKKGMIGYNLLGFNGFVIHYKDKLFVVEGMDINRSHYDTIENSLKKNLGSKIKVKYIFR